MQIGSKFTIGVHIITAIDYFKELDRVNSEFLAGSIGVNPVIVRTVISQLREAGLVKTQRGSSGAELAKPLNEITLYDIYRAVGSVDEKEGLFHFHEQPNPDCPVGRNIHRVLDQRLVDAQKAMEERLKTTTLADIAEDTKQAAGNESKFGQLVGVTSTAVSQWENKEKLRRPRREAFERIVRIAEERGIDIYDT